MVNNVLCNHGGPSWALALKGQLLRDQGHFDDALATLRRVTIDSETAWVPSEIAGVLFDLGRIHEASAAVESLTPPAADAAATLLKGRLLIAQSRDEEAIPVERAFASI